MRCDYCDRVFIPARSDARFCSTKHRVYWHRSLPKLPAAMTRRRAWVRAWGKVPMQVGGGDAGGGASSTDRGSWSSWAEVHRSSVGDGFGVMLGDGLGCWDLDHCIVDGVLTDQAIEVLAGIRERVIWVERSRSGEGLHVFVEAPEGPASKRPGVEFYSRARFIRVTGDRYAVEGLQPAA